LLLCIITAFITPAVAQDPFTITTLTGSQLPQSIKYNGKLKEAIRWTDKMGDNIVITVETGKYENPKFKHEAEGSDAELFAFHYVLKDGWQQVWKIYDFIQDCPVDLEASFVKKTLQVTDLNKDGTAEIWVMYRTVCHGDVSPFNMKIIMYEGVQKFAMRGETRVQVSEKEYIGGSYKFDKAFTDAPPSFRDFAVKLWNKNVVQTFE
jgi:hypothetical protein